MINVGGYLEYRGGVQYRGDIMSTVEVILSTVGDIQCRGGYRDARGGYRDARGGYHEYRGGVQYRRGNLLLFEYPTVLNTPMVLMISPHMYHEIY